MTIIELLHNRMLPAVLPAVCGLAALVFAPIQVFAEPEVTESTPIDGAVLTELPESLRLCFNEPVKAEPKAEWQFNMSPPDQTGRGLRIVFGVDETCVDLFPGTTAEPPQGIWSLSWLVHARSDGSEGSGVIRFQLGELQPGDTPLPKPKPPSTDDANDGFPVVSIVLIGVGAVIVIGAAAGFVARVRSRKQRA